MARCSISAYGLGNKEEIMTVNEFIEWLQKLSDEDKKTEIDYIDFSDIEHPDNLSKHIEEYKSGKYISIFN